MVRDAAEDRVTLRGARAMPTLGPRLHRDAPTSRRFTFKLLAVVLVIAAVALCATGCADACATLSSQVCERLGAADSTCVAIRSQAERPRPGDGPACEVALAFAHELQRSR